MGIPRGDSLNFAWSRIVELSDDPVRRAGVVKLLKTTDPFPDRIFDVKANRENKRVIAKFLEKNFPEFWPVYFQKCLEFYSGKGEFPYGNPTLNCQHASDLTETSYIYSQKVNRIISALKKK